VHYVLGVDNDLRQRLFDMWTRMERSIIDNAIDQWNRRLFACIRARGVRFEYSLCHTLVKQV